MKKISTLLLALVVCAGTMLAWDYERVQIDGLYYNLDATNQTAEVTSQRIDYPYWLNSITSAHIPSSVTYNAQTYTVTSIGYSAFYGCWRVTSVTIPNTVTSIGVRAFYECTGLTSVTIPNSVTSIGNEAFWSCSGLTSVTIPNSVTSFGDGVFSGCSGLTSLSVEAGNTVYDSRNNCNAIIETSTNTLISGCQNTTIPNSVTSIGNWAFNRCTGLISVTIPNSVTSIGSHAFYKCTGLTSVTIPNSVTNIGEYTFSGCTGLTSITNYATTPQSIYSTVFGGYPCVNQSTCVLNVPKESVSLYQAANVWKEFWNIVGVDVPDEDTSVDGIWYNFDDEHLTAEVTFRGDAYNSYSDEYSGEVVIPSSVTYNAQNYSVTSIGDYAFYQCTGLTSVTIPNSIISIGSMAFAWCDVLATIEIPNTVTNIGGYAFACCSSMSSITVAEDNTSYSSENGVLFNKEKTVLLQIPGGKAGSYTIPNSVVSIGDQAFVLCNALTSINAAADHPNYSSLDGVLFNKDKTTLVQYPGGRHGAFIIPNGVEHIGNNAFTYCSFLTFITIPNSVTSIGNLAFYGCDNLRAITCYAISPPSCGVAVFYIDKSTCKLYVPAESTDLYMTSLFEWRDFQIGGAAMTAKADPDDASTFYTTFYHGSQKYKLPAGMEAYTATINGDVLELSKVAEGGDVIPAGTAFILKSNAANLTLDASDDTPVSVGENILQGVDAATPAPDNCYVLSGGSSDSSVKGIGFYRFSGTLGAHKAYLVLAPKAGAPRRLRFAFSETNTTTNVEQVPSIQVPSTKVIENGQLYIMHEGQMYDVRGNKVQ